MLQVVYTDHFWDRFDERYAGHLSISQVVDLALCSTDYTSAFSNDTALRIVRHNGQIVGSVALLVKGDTIIAKTFVDADDTIQDMQYLHKTCAPLVA